VTLNAQADDDEEIDLDAGEDQLPKHWEAAEEDADFS